MSKYSHIQTGSSSHREEAWKLKAPILRLNTLETTSKPAVQSALMG